MKIRIKGNPFTPYGEFTHGDILTDDKYPAAFLTHLVKDANAADFIDYETKIDDDIQVKKNPSSPSSQPAKVSRKKTATLRLKKPRSSQ